MEGSTGRTMSSGEALPSPGVRPACPLLAQVDRGLAPHIVNRKHMASIEETEGHRITHGTSSDKAKLHRITPLDSAVNVSIRFSNGSRGAMPSHGYGRNLPWLACYQRLGRRSTKGHGDALYDLVACALGVSLYNLLGGCCGDNS
jgi:hypothetical protein